MPRSLLNLLLKVIRAVKVFQNRLVSGGLLTVASQKGQKSSSDTADVNLSLASLLGLLGRAVSLKRFTLDYSHYRKKQVDGD